MRENHEMPRLVDVVLGRDKPCITCPSMFPSPDQIQVVIGEGHVSIQESAAIAPPTRWRWTLGSEQLHAGSDYWVRVNKLRGTVAMVGSVEELTMS